MTNGFYPSLSSSPVKMDLDDDDDDDVLCACPPDVGIVLCVFAPCFAYSM